MKATPRLVLLAALIGVSGAASAAYSGTREDRMQAALDDYHNGNGKNAGSTDRRYTDPRNPSPGPAARAESSMKRGASDAGHSIKRGASKVGHAVGTGLSKTGEAIDHAGAKLKGKTAE